VPRPAPRGCCPSRAVIDHDLLSDGAREPVGDETADDVRRRAGREGDDHPDRPRRPGLGVCRANGGKQRQKKQTAEHSIHGALLLVFVTPAKTSEGEFRGTAKRE